MASSLLRRGCVLLRKRKKIFGASSEDRKLASGCKKKKGMASIKKKIKRKRKDGIRLGTITDYKEQDNLITVG